MRISTSITPTASVDTAIQYVTELERVGVDEVLCLIQMGTVPQEMCLETIRHWGEEVIPHFRAKTAGRPPAHEPARRPGRRSSPARPRAMCAAEARAFVGRRGAAVVVADVAEDDRPGGSRASWAATPSSPHLDVSDGTVVAGCGPAAVVSPARPAGRLVNNAAPVLDVGRWWRRPPPTLDAILAVNLRGPFLGIQAVAPLMARRRWRLDHQCSSSGGSDRVPGPRGRTACPSGRCVG